MIFPSKMEPFRAPAILDGMSPRKDGTMSVRFVTQEMAPAEKLALMEYYQQFGWLLFAPQERELSSKDIPEKSVTIEGKTHSQRLRSVLYLVWDRSAKTDDFDTFYHQKMEAIIDQVKFKLS